MHHQPTESRALRALPPEELARLGDQSLRDHLLAQAIVAHTKHAALQGAHLDAFLHDPACLRHPTRLLFEFGEMALHQFAHPDIDPRDPAQDSRVLYLRPLLRDRPDLIRLAVAYLTPVLNYGEVVRDEHCLVYGAALLGLMEDEYYSQLCSLADLVGAEPLTPRFGDGPQ